MDKKTYFNENKIDYIDYKDVDTLKAFLTPHARIQSRRKNKNEIPSKNQRQLAVAIKRARFMGLLPYVSR